MTLDDERAELERILAADLAVLSDNEEEEEEKGVEETYKRLNLEDVLSRTAHLDDLKVATWTVLMASVADCDARVFRVFQDEMEELTTSVLPALAAVVKSISGERAASTEKAIKVDYSVVVEFSDGPEAIGGLVLHDFHTTGGVIMPEDDGNRGLILSNVSIKGPDAEANAVVAEATTPTMTESRPLTHQSTFRSDEVIESSPIITSPTPDSTVVALNEELPDSRPYDMSSPEPDDLHIIMMEHDVRRRRVQEYAEQAQQELDAWFQVKIEELEHTQRELEVRQHEAACERKAQVAMANEERAMRGWLETQRMAKELAGMEREDQWSQQHELFIAHELEQAQHECQHMAKEEACVWRFVRGERELRRKGVLMEEESRLRRWHRSVLVELVAFVAARFEAERKRMDAERRRAQREASLMRSEESLMRRFLVHKRMMIEAQARQYERKTMEMEEMRGQRLRQELRQRQEEFENGSLAKEDTQSRVWETLWRLRIKHLRMWFAVQQRRNVMQSWRRWTSVVHEMRSIEDHQHQCQTAAHVIQSAVRRWSRRQRRREEAMAAARVVQSAFRGFHVRRKFQNALELAQRMVVDDDEFGEVNFEELIGAPPELDDDWEKPMIPPITRPMESEPAVDEGEADELKQEEEEEEGEDTEKENEEEALRQEGNAVPLVPRHATPWRPPEEEPSVEMNGNLAVVLWNKMRKRKQKQKWAIEERQKQQDPVYRVQKLLGKPIPPPQSYITNQQTTAAGATATTSSSVCWATNSDKKKAPKVKLPSLVERLRKKTAAAR